MNRVGPLVSTAFLCAVLFCLAITTPAYAARAYAAELNGAPDRLRDLLKSISKVIEGAAPLPTRTALRRQASIDIGAMVEALQAKGYYAATGRYDLQAGGDQTIVRFHIDAGERFEIAAYELRYVDVSSEQRPADLKALQVRTDGGSDGAALQRLQLEALGALRNGGYAQARAVGRRVEIADGPARALAVFEFESGPRTRLGVIDAAGLQRVKPAYLDKLRTWKNGDLFEQDKLVAYRDALAQTGLFTTIDVAPGPMGDSGVAPVLVTLEERKRRTIGAGASFSTAEGPGGRIFFEQRNLFGAGERARAEIAATAVSQALALSFDKPMPGLPGALFAQLGYTSQTTDAFTAQTVSTGAGLSRRWFADRLETRSALAFESSSIKEGDIDERTYLFSAPLSVAWDTEDDPLFLSQGERIALTATPMTGSDTFVRTEFTARSRISFGDPGDATAGDRRLTLAGRIRLGATFGSSLANLPLTQRFFAGGGSSVRGYGFQEAGPLDGDGDPVGGRSVVEAAIETRYKLADAIEIAAFADAGTVSASAAPDFTGDYFIGIGGGARYFTPIGPLRVDVAFPLERRPTDAGFQLFISLGQPF